MAPPQPGTIPISWKSVMPAMSMVVGTGSTGTKGNLNVGVSGTGTLYLQSGGQVTSTSGAIGATADSTGTLNISGSGSLWNNAGTPSLLGTSKLNLNGGQV